MGIMAYYVILLCNFYLVIWQIISNKYNINKNRKSSFNSVYDSQKPKKIQNKLVIWVLIVTNQLTDSILIIFQTQHIDPALIFLLNAMLRTRRLYDVNQLQRIALWNLVPPAATYWFNLISIILKLSYIIITAPLNLPALFLFPFCDCHSVMIIVIFF